MRLNDEIGLEEVTLTLVICKAIIFVVVFSNRFLQASRCRFFMQVNYHAFLFFNSFKSLTLILNNLLKDCSDISFITGSSFSILNAH
jgi:hypothetical protein